MPLDAGSDGRQNSEKSFVASDHANDNKKHLLIAASGSVATIKIPNIIYSFSRCTKLSIRLVLTSSARKFLQGQSAEQPTLDRLRSTSNLDGIYSDEDEWSNPWVRGAPILHIEFRRWADMMLIAPLSANSLAKMSFGLADNLLLSIVRAWDTTGMVDGKKKCIIVAPAMNTAMWVHPVTKRHLSVLEDEWGVANGQEGWIEVLSPAEKTLACGDSGNGAMREWSEIVAIVKMRLGFSNTPHPESPK